MPYGAIVETEPAVVAEQSKNVLCVNFCVVTLIAVLYPSVLTVDAVLSVHGLVCV